MMIFAHVAMIVGFGMIFGSVGFIFGLARRCD
jgi:hypothetical protein